MKSDLKIDEHNELVIGEVLKVDNKFLVPVYSMKVIIIKKPAIIWIEAHTKGIILTEKKKSWYLPFEETG